MGEKSISIRHLGNSRLVGTISEFSLPEVRIGRRAFNDLKFDPQHDLEVSGQHAVIRLVDGAPVIEDVGSTNGVFVNDRRIAGPTRLLPADRVVLGSRGPVFSVECTGATSAPKTIQNSVPATLIANRSLKHLTNGAPVAAKSLTAAALNPDASSSAFADALDVTATEAIRRAHNANAPGWGTLLGGPASEHAMERPPENGPYTSSQRGYDHAATLDAHAVSSSIDYHPRVLRRLFVWNNWPVKRNTLPEYLIRGRGESLEQLAAALVSKVSGRDSRHIKCGLAWESSQMPGQAKVLRFVHRLGIGHRAATDVTLQRQGDDLYVRLAVRGFTLIAILRKLLLAGFLIAFLCGSVYFMLYHMGVHRGWAQDYANKYKPTLQLRHGFSDKGSVAPVESAAAITSHILEGGNLIPPPLDWKKEIDEVVQSARGSMGPSPFGGDSMNQMMDNMAETAGIFFVYQYYANVWKTMQAYSTVEPIGRRLNDAIEKLASSSPAVRKSLGRIPGDLCDSNSPGYYVRDRIASIGSIPADFNTWNQITKSLGDATSEKWTLWELFRADPKVFLIGVAGIPAVLSMIAWGALIFIPNGWLRLPCLLLRWPSPETMTNTIESHKGSVMSDLTTAQSSIGMTSEHIIHLGSGRS